MQWVEICARGHQRCSEQRFFSNRVGVWCQGAHVSNGYMRRLLVFQGHYATKPCYDSMKIIVFLLLCNRQGHLRVDQVAQRYVLLGSKPLQGWGLYHLSANRLQCVSPVEVKKFFVMFHLNVTSSIF